MPVHLSPSRTTIAIVAIGVILAVVLTKIPGGDAAFAILILVGSVAFVLFALRRELQKSYAELRAVTGRCARCGYDLRSSKDRCPECGDPILPNPIRERYRPMIRREAEALLDRCIAYYAQPRTYVEVSLSELVKTFPDYPLPLVESLCQQLQSEGFRPIADFLNQTHQQLALKSCNAFRLLLSPDGITTAAVGDTSNLAGFVYFRSELPPTAGFPRFLVTDAVGHISTDVNHYPPEESHETHPLSLGPIATYRHHQHRLAQLQSQPNAPAPVTCRDLTEINATTHRIESLAAAHGRSFGYVHPDTIRNQRSPDNALKIDLLLEEPEAAKRARGLAAGDVTAAG